tara:strand:+ start:913 stop:1038 length:126 start_codon:yes stop_codon:yes gene_type:complete
MAITEAMPIIIASAVRKDLVAFDLIESRAVLIDSENNKFTP